MAASLPSYVYGASSVSLIGETIGSLLDRIADRWPDRPALVVRDQGIRWSYARFREEVRPRRGGTACSRP